MPVIDIALVWAEPATDPRTSFQPQFPYPTLREAIQAAQSPAEQAKHPGRVPWLRAGTHNGAEITNPAGIEMLRSAFNEGVAHRQVI
jgi:hypothetical protein